MILLCSVFLIVGCYFENSLSFQPRNIVTDRNGNIIIRCTVIPMSKFNKVSEINDHGVIFDLVSDTTDDEANEVLIDFLSDLLSIPSSDISITQGAYEACKTIMINKEAVTLEEVKVTLEEDVRNEI